MINLPVPVNYSNLPCCDIYFILSMNFGSRTNEMIMRLSVFFVCNLCCDDLFQRQKFLNPLSLNF